MSAEVIRTALEALQAAEDTAIESGAHGSYVKVGKAFDRLRDAIATLTAELERPAPPKTDMQERAWEMAADWHEGVPRDQYYDWCCRAAGLLMDFSRATPPAERPESQWPLKPLEKVQVYLPDSEIQAVCRPAFAYFDSWAMGELEDRLKAPPAERPAPEPVAWISVEDRLPETAEPVLAWNGRVIIPGAQYYQGSWIGAGGVTHWMPLPTAPSVHEDEEQSWLYSAERGSLRAQLLQAIGAALAASPAVEPQEALTECNDNDSPWLVCKPCAAVGRCAKEEAPAAEHAPDTAPEPVASDRNPWRDAIDEALVASGLDCLSPDDKPKEALTRLVDWEKTIALDPRVSEQAVALLDKWPSLALQQADARDAALTDEQIEAITPLGYIAATFSHQGEPYAFEVHDPECYGRQPRAGWLPVYCGESLQEAARAAMAASKKEG